MNFSSCIPNPALSVLQGYLVLCLVFINSKNLDELFGNPTRIRFLNHQGIVLSNEDQHTLLDPFQDLNHSEGVSNGRSIIHSELPGKQIRFEKISIENGLSQSTVTSIFQDSKGFIWLGTEDGLNKYNGYEFIVYRHDPDDPRSISDNSIQSIHEDHNQVLWIGTNGKGLNRFDRGKEQFTHYRNDPDEPGSIPGDSVTSISNDASGRLWIGTSEGLARFDDVSQEFFSYRHDPGDPNSLGSNHISDIHLDRNGELWVGTFGGGLHKYDPGTDSFIRFQSDRNTQNQISSNFITSISEDSSGRLWIGTGNGGLNLFDPETVKFYYYNYDSEEDDPKGVNAITSVEVGADGMIWVGLNGSGIDILNPRTGSIQNLSYDQGDPASLSSDLVYNIFRDNSGIIWAGTSGGGVNRFDPSTARFIHYRHISGNPDSLSANNVQSIAEDKSGDLWIGIYGGGLNYINRRLGRIQRYQPLSQDPFSLSSDDVRFVLVDKYNDVWIGTIGGGLNRYSPSTKIFTHYLHDPGNQDSIASDSINVIFEDRDGFLWIGTNGAGLDRFDRLTSKFFHYRNDPNDPASLSNDQIWEITEDRTGNLWIGTGGGGISILDQETGKFTQVQNDPTDPNSLGDTDILSIYEDKNGVIWIGTNGSGLDKFDPLTGDFSHYRVSDGLANNVIHGILEDRKENLWVSTNLGLSSFNPSDGSFKNYDVSDGLQSNEFNSGASFLDSEGMMYFGGINGLTAFYPADIQDSTYMPPVVFTGLNQSGVDLLREQLDRDLTEVVLNWSNNNLEFEFVALNFAHPEKSRYAYKLTGFDEDWNYIGSSRNGRYTNLPAGSYTLQVKATNSDGYWNDNGASLDIKVVPPFWETWWFIGLVTIIVMGSVISAYRLRIRAIESRSQELESIVRMRTEEIERRRLEMESLYQADEIIDQNLTREGRLKALVDVSIDLLDADNSAIYILDQSKSKYNVIAERGFKKSEIYELSILGNDSLAGEAAQSGDAFIVSDLEKVPLCDDRPNTLREYLASEGIRSSIFLQIKFSNEESGLFNVNFYRPDSVGEEQIRVFKVLAQHSALSIQNAQLFEQLRVVAINEERSRLARDLHDSAKQKAFAALAQLGAAGGMIERNPEMSKEHLLEAEDLVYEVLQELIILIQEMYPVALREKGFANSVREYIYDWENQCDLEVDLRIQDERKLPLEIEQSLYRVIQESLANIARHSQAKHVKLSVIYHADRVRVEISDDGIGFDVDEQPSGLGLRSMKERIDLVRGDLRIYSKSAEGTKIIVETPVSITGVIDHIKIIGDFDERTDHSTNR